jgi:hypothetical protein
MLDVAATEKAEKIDTPPPPPRRQVGRRIFEYGE